MVLSTPHRAPHATRISPPIAHQLTSRQISVLMRMLSGATQDLIARELKVSVRTIEGEVAQLRRSMSAPTRYTLGAVGVRWGYVASARVLDLVRDRCGFRCWMPPTPRQAVIIKWMNDGHPYEKIAAELEVSSRTVRRDLKQLIIANGAVDLVTAGALFEALGWHDDDPKPGPGPGAHPRSTATPGRKPQCDISRPWLGQFPVGGGFASTG